MGEQALPALVRIAENKNLGLKTIALNSMKLCSRKNFGLDLAKWKAYAETITNAAKTKREQELAARQRHRKELDKQDLALEGKKKAPKQPEIEEEE